MSGVPDLVRLGINHFYGHSLALIIAIITVWTINYTFSFLLSLWIVIFIIGSIFFSKRAKTLCRNAAEVRSTVVGQMVDILSNMMSVHLFAAKKTELKKLTSHLDEYVIADQRRDWLFLYLFLFQGLSFVAYEICCIIFLISGFKAGTVTVGDFVLLLTINMSLIDCLWILTDDILKGSEIIGNITQGLR